MDEDTVESNLNTLKEIILDEQKLVTYVSLSKDLCIHVNDSKYLLKKFVQNIRTKLSDLDLNVCFIISGLTGDNKARTTVSSEKEIEEVRNSLKTVFFEHIYSVCKGSPNLDNVALLAVNKFDDFLLCTGLIKNSSCAKRTPDEIGNLKTNSQAAVQTENKPLNPPLKKVKEESKESTKKAEPSTVVKVQESKSEPSIKTEVISPKKDSSNNKLKPDKKNGIKAQKGIAGFFNKSNSAPSKIISQDTNVKKELPVKESEAKKDPPIVKVVEMDIDEKKCEPKKEVKAKVSKKCEPKKEVKAKVSKTEVVEMDIDEEKCEPKKEVKAKVSKTEVKKGPVNGKSKNKSNEKLNLIKKNAKVDKKRKRVLHVSDSESDEEKDPFVDEPEHQDQVNLSEDEIPPTPTVNTVKITSGIVNPKKRRKVIDKTYTDEEGYILTKKVEVYESCSDNEDGGSVKENIQETLVNHVKQEISPKEKKNGAKASKKKISPPQKGKQATMMNFFKKI